jgi:hypothetical protein
MKRNALLLVLVCTLPGCVGLITYSPSFNDCQYVRYERQESHVTIQADCELAP